MLHVACLTSTVTDCAWICILNLFVLRFNAVLLVNAGLAIVTVIAAFSWVPLNSQTAMPFLQMCKSVALPSAWLSSQVGSCIGARCF